MNAAQLHLALNHAPLFSLGFGLLVFLYSLLRKSTDVLRAGLYIFVLGAILTIPAYLTGDGAEHVVENMAGVEKRLIEPHEEAATTAFVMTGLTGLAALAGLWLLRSQRTLPKLVTVSIFALAILSIAVVGYTAKLGGMIHHPETRVGFVAPPSDDGEWEKD
ncbi:MAG: hypothetical protein ACOZB3_04115 [Calditrichota bacterium]